MDYLNLLALLVFAHFIADFPLQGDFLANMKGKYDYLLFAHCVIWAGCVSLVLVHFGVFTWTKFTFLLCGHFVVDRIKARAQDKTHALTRDLWFDQFVHGVQLVLVAVV
jgi:hypothetical protein